MSETARNFVSTCLTVDPGARPTAEQMLQHPWLTAEVPPFVEAAYGEPADLLPHVRKAFNARRTCTFRFVQVKCILMIASIRAVRKAVFAMMAIKRMSTLAHHYIDLHDGVALHHDGIAEGIDFSQREASGSGPSSDHIPSLAPTETTKESKEVTDKLASESIAASEKVSGAAK